MTRTQQDWSLQWMAAPMSQSHTQTDLQEVAGCIIHLILGVPDLHGQVAAQPLSQHMQDHDGGAQAQAAPSRDDDPAQGVPSEGYGGVVVLQPSLQLLVRRNKFRLPRAGRAQGGANAPSKKMVHIGLQRR